MRKVLDKKELLRKVLMGSNMQDHMVITAAMTWECLRVQEHPALMEIKVGSTMVVSTIL